MKLIRLSFSFCFICFIFVIPNSGKPQSTNCDGTNSFDSCNGTLARIAVANHVGGRVSLTVRVESSFYSLDLVLLASSPEIVLALDLASVESIEEPTGDYAVFTEIDAKLTIPSLLSGEFFATNVVFELTDTANFLFTLRSFDDRPSLIFFNGQVLTMEADLPQAEALAVAGNTIFAVGSNEDVLALSDAETQLIDLAGKALLPGFVDPHNHVYNAIFLGQDQELVGTSYTEAQQRLIEAGVTTVANANIWPGALVDFLRFAESDDLRIRTSVYLGYNDNCGGIWPKDWYRNYPLIVEPEKLFRIPGIKIFTDGGSCLRMATSYEPFGDLFISEEELAAVLIEVQELGYQALIHALGDRAVDTALNGIELALQGGANTYRHRIDHNRLIRPEQLPRYGELGVIPVVFGQSITCAFLGTDPWSVLNDDEHAAVAIRSWFEPWRALIDTNPGIHLAWKSDANFFPLEPITNLWSLVTKDEKAEDGSTCSAPDWLAASAVDVDEALHMMNIEGAYALLMEKKIGSLMPGKFADLVVLSDNPLTIDQDALIELEVLMTMIGGSVEYCLSGQEQVCPAESL